jgi:hypothetical protein
VSESQASRREVVIHAGLPKTGSTALQSFLNLNRSALLGQGVFLPKFPTDMSHRIYMGVFDSRNAILNSPLVNYPRFVSTRSSSAVRLLGLLHLSTAIAESRLRSAPKVLLSAEHFVHLSHPKRAALFFSSMKLFGRNISTALYLRDPLDWYVSEALQSLKRGVCPSPRLAMEIAEKVYLFSRAVFANTGKPPIFRAYSPARFENGDVRRDFLEAFLRDVNADALDWSGGAENSSISAEEGIVLSEIRDGLKGVRHDGVRPAKVLEARHALTKLAAEFKMASPRLTPEIHELLVSETTRHKHWFENVISDPPSALSPLSGSTDRRATQELEYLNQLTNSQRARAIFSVNEEKLSYLREWSRDNSLLNKVD